MVLKMIFYFVYSVFLSLTRGGGMHFPPVSVEHLGHSYGGHLVYSDLSLTFEEGKIYGLLGKNGVGKTTLIRILMGFLKPKCGMCRIFGDPAHAIRPATRARVGLLFERHLAYDFFTISQLERFMARFYPRWKPERYYGLVEVLGLPPSHKIAHMSEGQRSQAVLGLMLAQDPELLILDDYSMGLDAGYRRLFVDYLRENLRDGKHTVVLTSHVIQDMDRFVDEVVFLRRGGQSHMTSLKSFMETFRCYRLPAHHAAGAADALQEISLGRRPLPGSHLVNMEAHRDFFEFFTFHTADDVREDLTGLGLDLPHGALETYPMNMEDAFVGYSGRR